MRPQSSRDHARKDFAVAIYLVTATYDRNWRVAKNHFKSIVRQEKLLVLTNIQFQLF